MGVSGAVILFRADLRLSDNPALVAAIARGLHAIPLYTWNPDAEGPWRPGAASRCWLHHSLAALKADLKRLGSDLIVRRGPTLEVLREVLAATGARALFWNRRYEPLAAAHDAMVESELRRAGCAVGTFNASLLWEPADVRTRSGTPFQVFTPFYKRVLALDLPGSPLERPASLAPPPRIDSLELDRLELLPRAGWGDGLTRAGQPGEAGAARALTEFLAESVSDYREQRDYPARHGTSRLSPHLHFGEISPRQAWHALAERQAAKGKPAAGAVDDRIVESGPDCFRRELIWREFAHHILHHFPHTPDQPLRSEFAGFPWRDHGGALRAWQRGRTGYPIVDAGMRELWATGWLHNRVRMIVASFLVKHLLIDWREGARWFWDTLVDADLANNTLGWQWSAGCGADAVPYFRIFNPSLQGEKFDPQGEYVQRWLPELALLRPPWIHRPWEAPPAALAAAGVRLGTTYPLPIVEHKAARERALAALKSLRHGSCAAT